MPITPWIPAVSVISDGEDVSAEVVNPILAQHTQREQYLYEQFATVADKSVLIGFNIPIIPQSPPVVQQYSVVYYNSQVIDSVPTPGLSPAQVDFVVSANSTAFTVANSSFSLGIVKDINGSNADVYLMGLVQLGVNIDDPTYGIVQSTEINQSAPFPPGPFYLSRNEAGKITRNPGGIAIYVGYAFDRQNFLLCPNVNQFNQFYITYGYNILDRPAGFPVLADGTWTISNADLTKVGWVPVTSLSSAMQALAPAGALFFYNIPGQANVNTDTGITPSDQLEQIDLGSNLPPNPPNLTNLLVNGIAQNIRDNYNTDGLYVVDNLGIWWFDNTDGQQPWSSDLPPSEVVTADSGSTPAYELYLPSHGFAIDDVVQFQTTGTLPTGLSTATNYYVVVLDEDGNHFQVSATSGGSAIVLTDNGSGTHTIPQPYIWKTFNGTEAYRPKIYLQFVHFNPSIAQSVVTSINPYNAGSNAIQFYNGNSTLAGAVVQATGDLFARLQLPITNNSGTSNGTAIQSVTYSESTGVITTVSAPSVSVIQQGNGITIGNPSPGTFIISSTASNAQGRVSSLEPFGAELLFLGYHSYLQMTLPSTLPSSVIGKILVPAGLPNADMTLVLIMVGLTPGTGVQAVQLDFSYAVSLPGSVLNTSTSSVSQVIFNLPNPYTAKTVFTVGNSVGAISAPLLRIPAAAFANGDCDVNFSFYRNTPANAYTGPIGILDMYWKIGS